MLARTPVLIVRRRPWQRVVPVVRRMHALRHPRWEIAKRLRISDDYVERALKAGAGIWSPEEWGRLTAAAAAAEAGR
ncbi:MAG: hypothetical protein K0S00_4083 [Xanthobacteraceae bacterium]|nr:hypothetical protein [Xanthobacteraceae bacterium]